MEGCRVGEGGGGHAGCLRFSHLRSVASNTFSTSCKTVGRYFRAATCGGRGRERARHTERERERGGGRKKKRGRGEGGGGGGSITLILL